MQIGTIDIPGLAELDALLSQLGTAVATGIVSDGIEASAVLLRDAWTKGAPFDPNSRAKTWTTKDGMVHRRDYGHLNQNIRVGSVRPRKEHAVVFKVTTGNAFWGYFREIGTVNQRARPWARPIVEQLKGTFVTVQVDVIRAGIESVIGDGVVAVSRPRFGATMANGRNG